MQNRIKIWQRKRRYNEERTITNRSKYAGYQVVEESEEVRRNFYILTEPRWSARASILYTHTSDLQWFIGIEGEYEKANGNPSYENKKYFSLQFGLLF